MTLNKHRGSLFNLRNFSSENQKRPGFLIGPPTVRLKPVSNVKSIVEFVIRNT